MSKKCKKIKKQKKLNMWDRFSDRWLMAFISVIFSFLLLITVGALAKLLNIGWNLFIY